MLGVILLVALWIGGSAVVIYPAVWLAEQFALASGREFGRGAWVAALAIHAAAVFLAAGLGVAAVKTPRFRAAFQLFLLAGLFILFMIPVQLVAASQAQLAALLQIAATLAYLGCLSFIRRRDPAPPAAAGGSWWPPILAAALIGWPWVAWGALGSWLDSLINVIAALLFGLSAGRTFAFAYGKAAEPGDSGWPLPFGVKGFVAGTALLAMGAAFGHNGQQLVLLFLLAGLGWLVTAIGHGDGLRDAPFRWPPVMILVGLVVAAPLLFLDPEELALILNLGSRDVGYYAFLATVTGLATGVVLGIVTFLIRHRDGSRARALPALAIAAAVAGLAGTYLLVGQPGWHGERLYVVLADQADLSSTSAVADPVTRRNAVYEILTRHAATTQADLRRALDRMGIDYRAYYLVNALEVDAGPLVRLWLESRPDVDRVLNSPELRPLPEPPPMSRGAADAPSEPQWNLLTIGAPQVWADFGVLGKGIVIGQSDSGVDGQHPELSAQYRGNRPDGPTGGAYNWLDLWYNTTVPTDRGGHGTHTLGSVLGQSVGVAPDATWIGCVNLARNLGNAPRYLDCLQFMLAPFPQDGDPLQDGRPELGAHVLNNSWGCPEIEGCDPTALLPAVRALRAAGVFVVASAGNDGRDCETIYAPISLYDEVFTVGAVDEFGTMASFSSRGPVTADGSGRTKPDVVAPGVGVLSAFPGGTYEYSDGTSMAGPHVAGVVALLWSADPSLIGDIDRTERIITGTAQPLAEEPFGSSECAISGDQPDNAAGYGQIDAYAAVQQALGLDSDR